MWSKTLRRYGADSVILKKARRSHEKKDLQEWIYLDRTLGSDFRPFDVNGYYDAGIE
jgi:hypothetical protein